MKKPDTVENYIAAAPLNVQPKLKQLRTIIRSAAPRAEEKISYGMPYYGYKGRLVYFAHAKTHVGVYAMLGAMDALKNDVKPYRTSKATLQFSFDKKLPVALLKKLVKLQMKINETRKKGSK